MKGETKRGPGTKPVLSPESTVRSQGPARGATLQAAGFRKFSELFGAFRKFSEGHYFGKGWRRSSRQGGTRYTAAGRRGAVPYFSLQFPAFPWFSLLFPDYEKNCEISREGGEPPSPAMAGFGAPWGRGGKEWRRSSRQGGTRYTAILGGVRVRPSASHRIFDCRLPIADWRGFGAFWRLSEGFGGFWSAKRDEGRGSGGTGMAAVVPPGWDALYGGGHPARAGHAISLNYQLSTGAFLLNSPR
jgi:hypothetical protein